MRNEESKDQPSRWRAVQQLFAEALRRPRGQREAFVRDAADDDALADEVLELVRVHEDPGVEIGAIVERAAGDAGAAEIPYDRLGPYALLEALGEGGMGRVFLAERADDQFRQRVAVKILGSRLPGEQLLQRFRAERQILANLNHPYVAKLLDGGETDDGLPYLVMEYVEGEPIVEYCDRHELGLLARLELFLEVCDAVQHAHQNFVIHRDIKSGNILITADGHPKLLDFGIAKILEPDLPLYTVAETVADARLMTPANASPEQVLGRPITTATDVYALGLLLYELLTGQSAYETDCHTPRELEHAICETEPSRPSARVTAAARELPAMPSSTAARLHRTLLGDLDTIVLNALRKEPERRYPTVKALADDLRNYLEHRPVSARPDGVAYRAGKFIRRQRIALALGAIFVISIAAAAVQALIERDRATAEAERSAAVVRFIVETFESSDPNVAGGAQLTAKEALDRGARELGAAGSMPPETRALLGKTIAEVYFNLGLYDEAQAQLRTAIDLYDAVGDRAGHIASLRLLGATLFALDENEEALVFLREALERSEALYPARHAEVAESLTRLAHVTAAEGDYDAGVELFERAIAMYEELGRTDEPSYLLSLYGLGQTKMVQGRFGESEAALRKALDGAMRLFGEHHIDTIDYMQQLAITLHEAGDLEAAEPYYLRSNELENALLGEDHPSREYSLTSIGRLYRHMGRTDEAEVYLRAAVDAAQRSFGERHTYTAYDSVNLANLLARLGRYEEAEPLLRRALDIYAETLPGIHLYKASANIGLARLLTLTGRPSEARRHAEIALEMCKELLPPVHTITGNATFMLGNAIMLEGDLDAAEPLLLEGYEMIVEATPNDPVQPVALATLIEFYELRDDAERANHYRDVLAAIEKGG